MRSGGQNSGLCTCSLKTCNPSNKWQDLAGRTLEHALAVQNLVIHRAKKRDLAGRAVRRASAVQRLVIHRTKMMDLAGETVGWAL